MPVDSPHDHRLPATPVPRVVGVADPRIARGGIDEYEVIDVPIDVHGQGQLELARRRVLPRRFRRPDSTTGAARSSRPARVPTGG